LFSSFTGATYRNNQKYTETRNKTIKSLRQIPGHPGIPILSIGSAGFMPKLGIPRKENSSGTALWQNTAYIINSSGLAASQHVGLSENSVPLHPMVNDHYPY